MKENERRYVVWGEQERVCYMRALVGLLWGCGLQKLASSVWMQSPVAEQNAINLYAKKSLVLFSENDRLKCACVCVCVSAALSGFSFHLSWFELNSVRFWTVDTSSICVTQKVSVWPNRRPFEFSKRRSLCRFEYSKLLILPKMLPYLFGVLSAFCWTLRWNSKFVDI